MINTLNTNEARKLIELESKKGQVTVKGNNIDFNRIILENKKVNFLILDHTNKKDKLKQQDSSLNEVLCNLAKKNNITFLIDLNEILSAEKIERAKILSRIEQNIMLIKKSKCKLKLINAENHDKKNLFAFLLSLGADTKLAENAI